MKLFRGRYRSRKNMKRALGLGKTGHEGLTERRPMPGFLPSIVERVRSKFGSSKHRKARVLRFQARQR